MAVMLMCAAWLSIIYLSLPRDSNGHRRIIRLFLTPDQQGQILMKRENYITAAAAFTDPVLKGTALFKAGQFKEAAGILSSSNAPESLYNRGTALIMAGLYDNAIEVLERTVKFAPGFKAAQINLAIAKIRRQRNLSFEDDDGGTGGMLAADEFVFNDREQSSYNQETEEVSGGEDMSDAWLRELWLRRLDSRPKDFLRVKFAYQKAAAVYKDSN